VLLTKRRDVPIWVLPGGGIEEGETPETAIEREVKEETGIRVKALRKVALYTPTNRLTSHTYHIECLPVGEEEPTAGAEALDAKFFPFEEIPYKFLPVHREWMEDACKNAPHLILKPIRGVGMKYIVKYSLTHPVLAVRYFLSKMGLTINS